MKLGFNEGTSLGCSNLELDLKYCEEQGFDYIEIHTPKLREYLETHTKEELKEFFSSGRLKPYSFNSIRRINFRTEEDWNTLMEEVDLFCEVGKEIGCDMIVVVPTPRLPEYHIEEKTLTEIEESCMEAFHRIDERCKKNGWPMRIALEFVGLGEPAIFCVNTFEQAYGIVEKAGMDNVGLVLDTYHFFGMGSSLEAVRQCDLNKIFVFHINDVDELPRGFWRDVNRRWPGDGYMDLDGMFRVLKEKGYDEAASVEVFRPAYYELSAEENIRTAKEKSRKALSKYWTVE